MMDENKSPVGVLGHHIYKHIPLPFDWVVEYASDGTIGAAWRAEADAEKPSPLAMLRLLLDLRMRRPRARDTRLRDAAAAILLAWARADVSQEYADVLAPWIRDAARRRHPADWYIDAVHAVYRQVPVVGRSDLDYMLRFLSATAAELRANGGSAICSLAEPPYRPLWAERKRLAPIYARAVADAVLAPSADEVFALIAGT